jgi:mono/diheme cytochrome c family protein
MRISYDVNSAVGFQYKPSGASVSMKQQLLVLILACVAMMAAGCEVERRKSDAELGLTPEQAIGRRVYDQHCIRCHEPYSTRGRNGPSLHGIYKKQFMPSGIPANDDRITDIVQLGKAKMPAFGNEISPDQLRALLAYMKTL